MSAAARPQAAGTVATTCPYCGVGCGVLVRTGPGGVAVSGDPAHPANRGRLCSKGAALDEAASLEGRLLHPLVDGRRAGWEEALERVAEGLRRVIRRHGPEAVAFYLSGQLLTEDYYVANKLAKGFLGTPHVDTNSRLCMASTGAAHARAFGADVMPACYEDLEEADLVLLVGSNLAWCHPVLFQRLRAARQRRGTRVVVIDPRRTATCDLADLHLPLAPGTDVALFAGLLDFLRREDRLDLAYLERHASGWAEALAEARRLAPSIPDTARLCGLDEEAVATCFRWFAGTGRVVTVYSQGVNQSVAGTDKVNAILNCHLATGRIGRPGSGPLSVTGQPNAMGGREVGAMAHLLAAHMGWDAASVDRVRRFWGAPRMARGPGLKAVDLFRAVEDGRIRALWVLCTNPAVSLPESDRVRRALEGLELLVVSDAYPTPTTARAHVVLPAATWGERDGTVTNSERRISRQRPFRAPPGEARPDWWALCQVARRLGFGEAFAYAGPAAIFREHARLSAFENDGGRIFDIGALAGLSDAAYDALAPVRWPLPAGRREGPARLFAQGGCPTPDGRARLVPTPLRPPAHLPDEAFPLVLNTGRVRDQWHTMTRTGRCPRLTAHRPEPLLEMHPRDLLRLGLREGDLARVRSRWGEAVARVARDPGQRPGSVFLPMHWAEPFAPFSRADALVAAATDPLSGEPEFKAVPVAVEPLRVAWQAFLLARRALAPDTILPDTMLEEEPELGLRYLCRARVPGGWRHELAGTRAPASWESWVRERLGEGEWLELRDPARGGYRAALLEGDRLMACLFVASDGRLPPRDWLVGLLGREALEGRERAALLAGRPPAGADPGRLVCACRGVGERAVLEAVAAGADSVAALGKRLGAGTGCGSCVPELEALLARAREGRR